MLGVAGHDVAAGALEGKVGLLPAGSVEYHGPHGPLGADALIARGLAERVATGRPRLVLLPEVVYTPCPPETRDAPGTIDVPEPLVGELLAHLFRALFAAGVAGVIVVNAHEGNVRAVGAARDAAVAAFPGTFVEVVNWWETLPAGETAAVAGFTDNGGHGHAGPLEMSVTEAVAPGTVRAGLAADERLAREIERAPRARLLALAAERVGARVDELLAGAGPS